MEFKKKYLVIAGVIILVLAIIIYGFYSNTSDSFESNVVSFKSVLKQGESMTNKIKITSLKQQEFSIAIKDPQSIVVLKESNFSMDVGESKELELFFNGNNTKPGVYTGSFIVNSHKIIPIIIEVQSSEVLFATNLDVAPDYKQIAPGGKLIVGIKIYNLNDTKTHTLEELFSVKNLQDENIISEKEDLVVGTESITQKTINIPKDMPEGDYVFSVVSKYGDSVSTSSYLFSVSKKKMFNLDMNSMTIVFAIIIVVFLFGVIFLVFYIMRQRDKVFLELQNKQKSDLKFYSDNIDKQKVRAISKVKTENEKKKILNEFESAKERIIGEIKKEQEKQIKELEELKEQNKEKLMKQRVKQWKKVSYKKAVRTARIDPGLRNKLEALENARMAGFISKEAYAKGKSRIEKKIRE